jgi:hypothetical protein
MRNGVEEYGTKVPVEKWHGVSTENRPDLVSIELQNVSWVAPMAIYTDNIGQLALDCEPNLPWADEHFLERVSGIPMNPGEEYKNWPWYREGSDWDLSFREHGIFTHTYMERMWPKKAGVKGPEMGRPQFAESRGIRWKMGDLLDVVHLLLREPYTRQAFVPIWFPEDTGVVHEGRVPCTIGYQLMLRRELLHMWYIIRSCDVVRYMRDDVYMAIRLADWFLWHLQSKSERWQGVMLGDFTFHCFSLHMFEGDRYVSAKK